MAGPTRYRRGGFPRTGTEHRRPTGSIGDYPAIEVIILPNLYGNIVSDLCAPTTGALGVPAGANTYDLKTSRTDPIAVGTSRFADAVIEEMNA